MLFPIIPVFIRRSSTQEGDESETPDGGCLGAIVVTLSAVCFAFLLIWFVNWTFAVDYDGYTGTFIEFIGDQLKWFVGKLRRLC